MAIPLPESSAPWSSGVLRAALPASRIDSTLAASWRIPLIVWAVLLIPTLVVAYLLTRSIISPIQRLRHMTARVASGDLAYRTSVRTEDELGDLAGSLNTMAAQLEYRAEQLTAETERSTGMLEAMSEGVILIDGDGRLLRCNPAAEGILEAKLAGMEGSPFVFAARSFPARALAQKAEQAGHAITEMIELPKNRVVAVEVVPLQSVEQGGGQTLFVCATRRRVVTVERMRRDFATNVSHELKTPLAGLSLLAETLSHAVEEDPEEARRFVERLSSEITRLKVLTNELLTLSRLEEPDAGAFADFTIVELSSRWLWRSRPKLNRSRPRRTRNSPGKSRTAIRAVGDESPFAPLSATCSTTRCDTRIPAATSTSAFTASPMQPVEIGSSSKSAMTGSAYPSPTSSAFSNVSTGWTRRARAKPEAPGSVSASCATSPSGTGDV